VSGHRSDSRWGRAETVELRIFFERLCRSSRGYRAKKFCRELQRGRREGAGILNHGTRRDPTQMNIKRLVREYEQTGNPSLLPFSREKVLIEK
jgi:hypothetical protein